MPSKTAAAKKAAALRKTDEEVVGPFDDDRYLPTLGGTLAAGKTVTVKDGKVLNGQLIPEGSQEEESADVS